MPTARPRLTITLTPEIDRALATFSRITGESRSAFIVQVLAEALPHLEKLAVVMQRADTLKGKAREAATSHLASYAQGINGINAIVKMGDLFLDSSPSMRPPSAGGEAAVDVPKPDGPPLPNRGGRPSSRGGKVVKIGGSRRGS
jgi:hypothetical protein